MATNGILKFQGTNKATFVGATSNVVIDTVKSSLGIGVDVDGPTSNLHVVGNAYVSTELTVGGTVTAAGFAGNASTASALATPVNIGGVSFDGSAAITLPGVNSGGNQNTSGSAATLTTPRAIGGVSFNGSAAIDLPGVNSGGNQNTSGSAATLTTPRAIGGVNFDGSANITLPGVNSGGNQNTSGSAATLTTPRTIGGVNFDGSAAIVPTTFGVATFSGDVTVDSTTFHVDSTNNRVGIGTATPNFPLTIQETTTNTNTVTYPLALRAISSGTVDDGFGVGLRFQCERMDTDNFQSLAGSVEVYGTNIPGSSDLWNMRFGVRNNDTAVTPMTLQYDGNVGIGTTIPQTSLQIKDETDTSGTGDAFISGLNNNTSNRKPTECLRLSGKYHAAGSGALLRFTNQHDSGTNPNTGEYNLAGIAGFDYAAAWGGGLCFYTAPTTGTGGDLTARMVIDQAGNVGIGTQSPDYNLEVNGSFSATGPTTGANHGSSSTLYLLDTCFFKEWSYTNYVAPTDKVTFNTSTEIPDGAKAVLAEVFLSRDSLSTGDHQIHVLGKNHTGGQTNWRSGAGQPSTAFSADVDTRQTVELLMPGESDGFTHYFGKWHSSVIIPLENNKIYYSNTGNSSSTGWVYVRIRGYYI